MRSPVPLLPKNEVNAGVNGNENKIHGNHLCNNFTALAHSFYFVHIKTDNFRVTDTADANVGVNGVLMF